ncbi:cell growth regulator with EF hand domain protein 1 [Rhea pennata]|uniref:cell growth regulator with EF hand domain protein 1 n=1 Tax=Rhea pennata TaxID=8795 RepID=UPI002E25B6FB
MRNLPVALLALLLPADSGVLILARLDPAPATGLDPGEDPLSPEGPVLWLLRSAAERVGPPEPGAAELTREQALLYFFALHDHDGSRRLDGLELLQALSEAPARRDPAHPAPDTAAALVDRILETRDLDGDGLLDPAELLLPPPGGALGAPEVPAGAGAAAGAVGPEPGAELSELGQGPELPAGAAAPEHTDTGGI